MLTAPRDHRVNGAPDSPCQCSRSARDRAFALERLALMETIMFVDNRIKAILTRAGVPVADVRTERETIAPGRELTWARVRRGRAEYFDLEEVWDVTSTCDSVAQRLIEQAAATLEA